MNVYSGMVNDYFRLLKLYSKGKRFALFEQAWMNRINDYFVETDICSTLWKNVLKKCECVGTIEEQRIVVSSLMYIVYDIMTVKVKDYKMEAGTDIDTTLTATYALDEEPVTVFVESNVSLYRYGGFALHSLLQKYKQGKGGPNDAVVTVLKQLIIKGEQLSMVPYGVQQLNQGGLVIMNPLMLPYLRALIEKVSSLVNKERCKEFGKQMIEAACTDIENDEEIASTYIQCVTIVGIDSSSIVFPKIYNELSKKMFHARVNEYMTAAVEVELEKSGKAVKADQSLRDQLKTFSGMKTRT